MTTSSKRKGAAKKRPTRAQRVRIERRAKQRSTIAIVLVVVLVAGVGVALALSGGSDDGGTPSAVSRVSIERSLDAGPLKDGDEAPSFSAPGLAGRTVSWDPGAPTVLTVWAPWCPHCQKELPVLADVTAEFPGVELVSVATAIGEQPSRYSPESYMAERGLSFPVAIDDAENTLARGLGVVGFPTMYVVDADGTVRGSASGEPSEDDLRALIAEISQA
ncbi:MAG: TlpA disulfide reductase family protein [Actinomycetota bacterium]